MGSIKNLFISRV